MHPINPFLLHRSFVLALEKCFTGCRNSFICLPSPFVFSALPGLPSFLANSGFPQGLTMSYSLADTVVPVANIPIPMGFRLAGGINFMGFGGFGDILVSPKLVRFNVTMNPLKMGTLQLSLRKDAPTQGPNLFVEASFVPPAFKASFEGVSLFFSLSFSFLFHHHFYHIIIIFLPFHYCRICQSLPL
jgi:hypothetical protein